MSVVATIAGIVVPAVLLGAAVRRWYAPVAWRAILLFLFMTFVFLHGAVFTSRLPVPVDEVARGYPWRGVTGDVRVGNGLTNDTVRLFLPWMKVAREELFALRAPLWNRYSFSGYPLLANGEAAPFSPFFLVTLFVPLPRQIVAMAGLKIFVALLFGDCFARREGAGEWASCFAATAFAWSVFQTVFLYYSTTAVTALLPAALFALFLAQKEGRRRDVVLVALVVATLMANGHPESVLHIATVTAGLFAIDFALAAQKRTWLRSFRAPMAGAAAGLAISAPAWVPVLEQVFLSTRYAELRSGSFPVGPYPIGSIWAMVAPNAFGNPARGNWSWISNYSLIAASYAGLLVICFLVVAAVSRRTAARERSWIAFVVLLWLIAVGWTPIGRLAWSVPPFSVSANDKLRFGAIFLAAIVAAKALDRTSRRGVYVFGMSALVLGGLSVYAWSEKRHLVRIEDLAGPASLVVVLLTLLFWRRRAPFVAFLALALELLLLNGGFNVLVDARYYRPKLPIIEALREAAPHEPFRVAGLDWMFSPNASAEYGLEDVRGSDPMSYARYTELLRPIVIDDRSMDVDRIVRTDDRLFDLLNVRFLLTEPGVEPGGRWRAVYRGPDGVLFENPSALSRFFVRRGDADLRIRELEAGTYRVDVDARTPVEVGSSVVNGPGWTVTARGRRLPRADEGALVGFELPAGRSAVLVRYRPRAFYGSLPLALLGAGLLVFGGKRRVPTAME